MGPNHPLVNLIHQKTKIKKVDIVDIFKVLPECMAEAFFMANMEEGKPLDLGGINLRWKKMGKWGAGICASLTQPMKTHFSRVKVEQKYPLAIQLYKLMHPKNKERALKKNKLTDTTTSL